MGEGNTGKFRRWALAALLLCAGLCAAPAAAADLKAGIDAWSAGDYPRAVREWRPLANAGNSYAQYNMGQAYRLGRGVPIDIAIARSWFEKAGAQGHEQAQTALGLLLFQSGDRRTGLYWLKKAADRGDPRGQYVLGTAHFNGDGVAKDWARAYALMSRAAAQGMPAAATALAHMEKVLPPAERERGDALARNMAKAAPPARLADAGPIRAPDKDGPADAVERPLADRTRLRLEPDAASETGVLGPPAPARLAADDRMLPKSRPKVAAPRAATPSGRNRAAAATPKPATPPAAARAATAAAKPAPPVARPGGRWRVQLGAYESPAAARSRWAALRNRISGLAGLQPFYEAFGRFTRLRVGPLGGKLDADRLCASARAAGEGCFTVAP